MKPRRPRPITRRADAGPHSQGYHGGRKAMTPTAITYRTIATLQATIAGQVSVPGEAGYDLARQAWNLAVDQRPSVVVAAETAADVAHAVRFARAHGMRIAPQGTGHGAEPLES